MGTMKRFFVATLLCIGLFGVLHAMVVKYNTYLVNEAGLSYNKSYPIPLNSYGVDFLSFTSIASSVTFTSSSFTDGQVSTGTITVTSITNIGALKASDSFTVVNSTIPCGLSILVNGVALTSCVQWFPDTTVALAAISIKNAINANVSNVVASTGAAGTVFSTATVAGSYGNNMTLVSNTSSVTVTAANFSGGRDTPTLTINGQQIAFTVTDKSSSTATSIVNAINSNTFLNTIMIATNNTTSTIVWATGTVVGAGTNYVITTSTQAALTIGGGTVTIQGLGGAGIGQMWGGADASYSLVGGSATSINVTNNGFTLGLPVLYNNTGSTSITGLTNKATYYVIPITPNSLSLSATSTGAVAGLPLVLTSSRTSTTAATFTLAPLAIAGTPSYKWQVSNDGVTWTDYTTTDQGITVPSVSLAAYNSTGTVNAWDMGEIDYGFIRLNVTSPTQGAIKLQVVGNGKNSNN